MLPVKNWNHHGADLNLTPLIDVIFILLIFFMVTTQFRKPTIPINLPAASGSHQEDDTGVLLVMDEKGEMMLEGERVLLEDLPFRLEQRQQGTDSLSVTLACDKNLLFEQVVEVLDALNAAGIEHVGIRHETSGI